MAAGAATGERLRIFVSHSSADGDFCHQIVRALRDAGADVWYDEHNLGSGRLADVILREMGGRPIFVVILSKAAIASKWVKREVDWAEELADRDPSRVLLPVTAAPIERNDFGAENGWLAYYSYKRIEAPGFQPYPVAEAANRLLYALALTPRGQAPAPLAPQPQESVDDLITRGNALRAQGKHAEALPLFERAAQLDPNALAAWMGQALELGSLKRHQEAQAALDRVLALNPTYMSAWIAKGLSFSILDRYEDAVAAFDHALTLDPQNAMASLNKGVALYALKRYQEAVAALDAGLAIDPGNAFFWKAKGDSHAFLNQNQEALAAYDRSLSFAPNDTATWCQKGNMHKRLGQNQEALAAYERALALDANDAITWHNEGVVLYDLKRYREALTAYERALTLDPTFASAWTNKGFALRALGRTAEAEEARQRAEAFKK